MRLTFIGDTHDDQWKLPGGDILFHAGDLTEHGFRSEIYKQLGYLEMQLDKYRAVVVIAGNHDFFAERHPADFAYACAAAGLVMLDNNGAEVLGLKIWGSPVTPWFHDWAFNRQDRVRNDIWANIPANLDILMTHGAPRGILDLTKRDEVIGDDILLKQVEIVKPAIHVFGHVHECGGKLVHCDGVRYLNCARSVVDVEYVPGKVEVINIYHCDD
jgi:Icc-related predicted phosphoesterase